VRRRYVYRRNPETGQVESMEVGGDYDPHDVRQPVYTDRFMEGVRATDGTDISSRQKRNEWMKRNDFVDVGDCTGMWAKAAKEREAIAQGKHDRAARREEIGRAIYRLEQGRK
jgi:hypothetical protein